MSRERLTLLGVAGLLALHVFMLAGVGPGQHGPDPTVPPCHESFDAGTTGTVVSPACDQHGLHDMAAACLVILAGIALLGGVSMRRAMPRLVWPLVVRRWIEPVPRPPTPPPQAYGISRT